MINIFLILAIVAWPFGQLLLLTPWGSSFPIHLLDIISAFLFLLLFLFHRQGIKKDQLFKPLVLFYLVALLSLVVNVKTISLVSVVYYLRFVSYASFYFGFRFQDVKKYLRFLFISAIIFITLGFLQYFLFPDARFLKYLGFDDHYYRLIGSFFDPNFTGLVLVVFTILAPWPARLVPLIALALTFSRASFVSLLVGVFYLAFVSRSLKLLLILILLGLSIYLVPKPFGEGVNLFRTFSAVSRLENQKDALLLFSQKPIFGYGFNVFKQRTSGEIPNLSSGVDNSFIFVLVTTGIVGFAAFVNLLIIAFNQVKPPVVRAALAVILIHSLFNNSFFQSWILTLFFLLVSTGSKTKT